MLHLVVCTPQIWHFQPWPLKGAGVQLCPRHTRLDGFDSIKQIHCNTVQSSFVDITRPRISRSRTFLSHQKSPSASSSTPYGVYGVSWPSYGDRWICTPTDKATDTDTDAAFISTLRSLSRKKEKVRSRNRARTRRPHHRRRGGGGGGHRRVDQGGRNPERAAHQPSPLSSQRPVRSNAYGTKPHFPSQKAVPGPLLFSSCFYFASAGSC